MSCTIMSVITASESGDVHRSSSSSGSGGGGGGGGASSSRHAMDTPTHPQEHDEQPHLQQHDDDDDDERDAATHVDDTHASAARTADDDNDNNNNDDDDDEEGGCTRDGDASGDAALPAPATATSDELTTTTATTTAAAADECASVDPAFERMERDARVALERIAMRDPDTETRMAEYVAVLQRYRGACQERAMYREAHLLQQVLRNLRLEEETRHVRGLTQQQMDERRALEQAHRDAFRRFHHEWNERINAFEEQQLALEEQLLERQNAELVAFQDEMRAYAPRILRYSRALLHTRAKQVTLARQREYVRAYAEKRRGDALAQHDAERFGDVRSTMYARREAALRQRHAQEARALQMRVQGRRLYLERARKRELEAMLQHYLNVRRELASQQNIVRSKTGAVLLKYACNTKADTSASAMLVESAASGTFGTIVQRRLVEEVRALRASRHAHAPQGEGSMTTTTQAIAAPTTPPTQEALAQPRDATTTSTAAAAPPPRGRHDAQLDNVRCPMHEL